VTRTSVDRLRLLRALTAVIVVAAALAACRRQPDHRAFATPEEAVTALTAAVKSGQPDQVIAMFGPEGQTLIDSSDPPTARRNQQVFLAAVAERWRLEERGANGRTLVIGNEEWPFPVPLFKDARGWYFDTPAGREEILARRIGRNELAAIRACQTYVAAQRLYAEHPHDGGPAGVYARAIRSDAGRQNGLYWPPARGQKRSPLGDLVAQAAADGAVRAANSSGPSPFHGYYFRILTAQGPAARGGAKDYISGDGMSGGFALVAWPAQYDATGVMTFIVNHEGVVHEKDLGPETDAAGRAMRLYDPDESWRPVQ